MAWFDRSNKPLLPKDYDFYAIVELRTNGSRDTRSGQVTWSTGIDVQRWGGSLRTAESTADLRDFIQTEFLPLFHATISRVDYGNLRAPNVLAFDREDLHARVTFGWIIQLTLWSGPRSDWDSTYLRKQPNAKYHHEPLPKYQPKKVTYTIKSVSTTKHGQTWKLRTDRHSIYGKSPLETLRQHRAQHR